MMMTLCLLPQLQWTLTLKIQHQTMRMMTDATEKYTKFVHVSDKENVDLVIFQLLMDNEYIWPKYCISEPQICV